MVPPSLIDFTLSRNLADGVVVAGCAESACFHRLGIAWTEQRFAAERDPYLRARVPRDRVATVWTSSLQTHKAEAMIAAFADEVAKLPPAKVRSRSARAAGRPSVEPAEIEGGS
jgi:coenzyme F420-reducing hydrogenase delta subunit